MRWNGTVETHKRVCDSSPSRWHLLIAPSDPVWVTHIVAACGSDVWQTGLLKEMERWKGISVYAIPVHRDGIY